MTPRRPDHRRKALRLHRAKDRLSCLVADSPHSGRQYPADFGFSCDKQTLRQAEDAWIDKLFDFMPSLGVPFLEATFPRAYIDANRNDAPIIGAYGRAKARHEDPDFIPAEGGIIRSPVTPRHPDAVYDRPVKLSEAFNRVAQYHKPYHDKLAQVLDTTAAAHGGKVVHLNCHSMPSTIHRGTKQNRYDIILGTRDGETADDKLLHKLRDVLEARGYVVGLNIAGFRGAEIVRRHAAPDQGRHSIQVEINRKLYMNEKTLRPLPQMKKLKADLKEAIHDFRDYCDALPPPRVQKPVPKRTHGR